MSSMPVEDMADRIRAEYAEMPDLHLTFWQAQRLWNLPTDLCEQALSTLTLSGYLVRTRDGRYRRRHAERSSVESVAPTRRSV